MLVYQRVMNHFIFLFLNKTHTIYMPEAVESAPAPFISGKDHSLSSQPHQMKENGTAYATTQHANTTPWDKLT